MKIIYIENVRIPSERAHAYQIVQTCAWLGRMGHALTLVNPDRAGGKDVFAYFGLADRPFVHVLLSTFDALKVPFVFLKPFAYALQRLSFLRSLRAWVNGKTADAWYTRDPAMIDGLRGFVRGPWILELHDAPDAVPARWERVKPLVAGFVVISGGLKEDLVSRLGIPADRVVIAPDGFDPAEFASLPSRADARKALGIPEEAFVAIYAGSFYAWKGVDLVARAWAKTPPRAYALLIGGPEGDRRRIEGCVDPRVRDRVRILPAVSRAELVKMYPAADVGLLTSSSAYEIGRRFTSPIKQFEYLAAGLPVVASDVPSSHESLNASCARFYDSTEQGFSDTLTGVMEDAAWRSSAAAAARAAVQASTWEARAKRISDFLVEIPSRSTRP